MPKRYLTALLAFLVAVTLMVSVAASPAASSVSADTALKLLLDGNKRFVKEKYSDRQTGQSRRAELARGQQPFAVIVTCSDSRVPPELLFDQGLGDLFVIRVAGNVLDAIELGSIEYAVEHLGVKLVMILGHEGCGAVKAAADGGSLPVDSRLGAINAKLQPAVAAALELNPVHIYETAADINIANMTATVKNEPAIAPIEGVKILGAKYYLHSGEVRLLQ